jgi:uncharacterized membrane protein
MKGRRRPRHVTSVYNRVAAHSLERLAALSDGLFSIAMTLLILDIRLPDIAAVHSESDLWQALLALGPRVVMYLMSFLTLGIFWFGQQTQFNHFARADRDLAWIHIAFLAGVAVMPFSTMLLAQFITYRVALMVYWANIVLLGAGLYFSLGYARHAKLLKEDGSEEIARTLQWRIVIGQGLYSFAALLCIISTYWSIGFMVLVQLYYALAPSPWWSTRPRDG